MSCFRSPFQAFGFSRFSPRLPARLSTWNLWFFGPVQNRRDSSRHLVRGGHAVDLLQLALFGVLGEERGGLGVVGGKALLEGFGVVVFPALFVESLGHAGQQGVFIDLEADDLVYL